MEEEMLNELRSIKKLLIVQLRLADVSPKVLSKVTGMDANTIRKECPTTVRS